MLDALGHADDGGIAYIVCRLLSQPVVGFLNKPGQPGARLQGATLTPMSEDQLETLEVQARLVAVLVQGFAQLGRARGFGEARQRPDHLRLGVI